MGIVVMALVTVFFALGIVPATLAIEPPSASRE
jgi:hypothetical protein